MVFLRLLSLSALAVLASCWTPVFDENLSVAGLVRTKLALEREFTSPMNSGNIDGSVFQTAESHDTQVVVVVASTHNDVTEFQYEGLPPAPTNSGISQPLDVPLSDALQVVLQAAGTKVGVFLPTIANGSGVATAEGSGVGTVQLFAPGVSPEPLPFPIDGPPTAGIRTDLIGFSVDITPAQVLESFYLTTSVTGATLWQKLGELDTTTFVAPIPIPTMTNIPYAGTPGWMAVDMSGPTIFLTHAPDSSGSYVTDVIDASGLVASWKGHDHVVAFLSSGRLLTREGTYYNVCNSEGKILYSFPAGSLQFAGEYWDAPSASMRSRFSEALAISPDDGGGQDEVRVRYYSIKTSKLDTLQ